MRVKSTFPAFFNRWYMEGTGLPMVMLAIFCLASSFNKHFDPDLRAKQVNLVIRQIGDRLLLQSGDSTSRVLPVIETKKGTFILRFEKQFVFNHDSLLAMSQGLLPKTEFPSGYTVTVHDCIKRSIVYGFQVNNASPDILACSGRSQPTGCYTIEFVFPDFYRNVELKKEVINQQTESEGELHKIKPEVEELLTTTFNYDIKGRTDELKPVKVERDKADTNTKESRTTPSGFLSFSVVSVGMLVMLVGILLILRFAKISKPLPVQNQGDAIVKEPVQELVPVGKFLFNARSQRLVLGNEVISLTDKENKVLELLNDTFGELIPRETLMQKVWLDEGVITGRSLDMFISKLRKKLSADPDLKITNVHGKGYKLEMPERQII